MIIKEPYSDNALKQVCRMLNSIERRLIRITSYHDVAILYISSYLISNIVSCNDGGLLLNKIKRIVRLLPQNIICVIRSVSPVNLGLPNLVDMQRRSLDMLRDTCYVITFNKNKQFLNHAKFIIYYQYNYYNNYLYHGKYYGSTNFTSSGLAFKRGRKTGNYEEFNSGGFITRKRNLTNNDRFYLQEVLDLIKFYNSMYTDKDVLKKYILSHIDFLKNLLERAERAYNTPITPIYDLYDTFIDLAIAYHETLALLDMSPGKILTNKIINNLLEHLKPISIFELEVMIPRNLSEIERIISTLGITREELIKSVKRHIRVLMRAHEHLRVRYLESIYRIESYYDQQERQFTSMLKDLYVYHAALIRELLNLYI